MNASTLERLFGWDAEQNAFYGARELVKSGVAQVRLGRSEALVAEEILRDSQITG